MFHGLACNTRQFGVRESTTSKVVNEIVALGNQRLENKITKLTSLVRQLAIGQHHISPLLSSSLEDLVKQITTNNIQFQENVFATNQELQAQIEQLATTMDQL
ncbi:hypothetical protein CR513_36959, partial [Mucuna pruriens]